MVIAQVACRMCRDVKETLADVTSDRWVGSGRMNLWKQRWIAGGNTKLFTMLKSFAEIFSFIADTRNSCPIILNIIC